MVKASAKVADKGYTDVIKNGVAVRCFCKGDYVIVIRADAMVDKDIPYTPIAVKVNTNNEVVYDKYREIVSNLLLGDTYDYSFKKASTYSNDFSKSDRDSLTRIVATAYKQWYNLRCMPFL